LKDTEENGIFVSTPKKKEDYATTRTAKNPGQ
jgi:hypothetical protein